MKNKLISTLPNELLTYFHQRRNTENSIRTRTTHKIHFYIQPIAKSPLHLLKSANVNLYVQRTSLA